MQLKRDPEKGGTNADGSKSSKYCSYCYQNGAFTQPGITMEQMREQSVAKLKEVGFPEFIAEYFTRNTHKLERWAK